ncbi:MAG: DUF1517 domain-containing protein [Sandaracinaceae bacterium]|nr:DUF1517 domain-containing protein [Sandaracinaceae bacterium]
MRALFAALGLALLLMNASSALAQESGGSFGGGSFGSSGGGGGGSWGGGGGGSGSWGGGGSSYSSRADRSYSTDEGASQSGHHAASPGSWVIVVVLSFLLATIPVFFMYTDFITITKERLPKLPTAIVYFIATAILIAMATLSSWFMRWVWADLAIDLHVLLAAALFLATFFVALVISLLILPARKRARRGDVDLTAVTLAIDWRARRAIQSELKRMAESGATEDAQGLLRLLKAAVTDLKQARVSWLYANVVSSPRTTNKDAESRFRVATQEMRTRFKREVVRSVDGSVATNEIELREPRRDEGEGVVVVTIAAAVKVELMDVADPSDPAQIDALLEALLALNDHQLMVLEVIWSPAAEDDRMSTAELEILYPELKKLSESQMYGRVICAHCRAPFAGELGTCPHCGAEA